MQVELSMRDVLLNAWRICALRAIYRRRLVGSPGVWRKCSARVTIAPAATAIGPAVVIPACMTATIAIKTLIIIRPKIVAAAPI